MMNYAEMAFLLPFISSFAFIFSFLEIDKVEQMDDKWSFFAKSLISVVPSFLIGMAVANLFLMVF